MGVVVRQKVKGKGKPWWIFVQRNGERISRMVGDRHAAESIASDLRKQMVAGEFKLVKEEEPKIPEFSEYARRYLENYAKTRLKRNTWQGYEAIIEKHLLPVWSGRRLDEIRRVDVKQLLDQKHKDGFKPGTIENIKALVSGLFTQAYEDEILQANPALKLGKFIHKSDTKGRIRSLKRSEMLKFLSTVEEDFPDYYTFFLCAFRTGMRLGELLGLAWEDINFEDNFLEVCRACSHRHFDTPKSHKTRRIDLSNQLRASLLVHRGKLKQQFGGQLPAFTVPDTLKGGSKIHLVFTNRDGGPMDCDNLRHRVFETIRKKLDLPKFRIHDIRHTFATMLLQNGEPIHYVKEQMGHASITTTVDVYGHSAPGLNRDAVNRLDDPEGPIKLVIPGAA